MLPERLIYIHVHVCFILPEWKWRKPLQSVWRKSIQTVNKSKIASAIYLLHDNLLYVYTCKIGPFWYGHFWYWAFPELGLSDPDSFIIYCTFIFFFRQNIFASYRTRIYKFTLGCKFVQLQQLHMYIVII